jgi:hypothetical protein
LVLPKNIETSFSDLCSFFEELSSDNEAFFKLDAFAINKLSHKKGLKTPFWFNGLVRGLQKTQFKMSTKLMWLSLSEHAEMASHYKMSLARAELLEKEFAQIELFYFPTCGIGLDILSWLSSKRIKLPVQATFLISDIDPLICKSAHYNFSKHFKNKTNIICHDILEENPFDLKNINSYCFADPSRRKGGSKFSRGEYEPNLPDTIIKLEQYSIAQIKLSASEDIDELIDTYPKWHWTVNALGKEIKEIFGTWHKEQKEDTEHKKSFIISNKDSEQSFFSSCEQTYYLPSTRVIEKYIYLPHPALICSKLSDAWATKHEYPFKRNDIYYTCDQLVETQLFDSFETIDQCGLRSKSVKNMIRPFLDHNIEIINPRKALAKSELKILEQSLPKKKAEQKNLKLMPIFEGKKGQCFLLRQLSFCDPHYIA